MYADSFVEMNFRVYFILSLLLLEVTRSCLVITFSLCPLLLLPQHLRGALLVKYLSILLQEVVSRQSLTAPVGWFGMESYLLSMCIFQASYIGGFVQLCCSALKQAYDDGIFSC